MAPIHIPQDINVELLLSYLPQGSYRVAFKGLHRRNAYNDIVDIEQAIDETLHIGIARNSVYNALPEYLFHPIDRFNNLPHLEEKERFAEEIEKQAFEKESAHRFFAPIDLQMLSYRMMAREELKHVTERNSVLIDILCDRLTEQQRENRFIKKTIPFIPSCKYIRGNKTLLTLLLRKVFMDEGITIRPHICNKEFVDESPRYTEHLGDEMNSTYVGNVFDEMVMTYDVLYWPETVDKNFLNIVDEIEQYRIFVQDYFLSIEEILNFDISHDDPALRISDDETFNYLNYNTNL